MKITKLEAVIQGVEIEMETQLAYTYDGKLNATPALPVNVKYAGYQKEGFMEYDTGRGNFETPLTNFLQGSFPVSEEKKFADGLKSLGKLYTNLRQHGLVEKSILK